MTCLSRWSAVVLVCVLGSLAWPAVASDSGIVAVEAIGYATLEPGETLQDVHRKALTDAKLNAVTQAKVSVDVNVKVEDMQLREKGVRTRGMGFIENMEVNEAGLMPYTEPPVYRVRVRALVRSMPAFPATTLRTSDVRDAWKPIVALQLESYLSDEQTLSYRASIAAALRACGVEVVSLTNETPALVTTVQIKRGDEGDKEWLTVDWMMSFGEPVDPTDQWGNPNLRGNWLLAGGSSPSSEWWQRLGVMMAQDAVRLWSAPHPVRIVIESASEEQMTRLSTALGSGAAITVIDGRDPVIHVVTLPLAGNPLNAISSILREAALENELELSASSMAEVLYRQNKKNAVTEKPVASPTTKGRAK